MNDTYNSNVALALLLGFAAVLGLGILGYAVVALIVYIASRW